VNLQTATWGGSAVPNASAGTSKSVTFGTVSNANNPGGALTVTVGFGGQNVAVDCIVYELTATKNFADDVAGRSETDLGVDERLTLGFNSNPVGVTALQAGGLQWKTLGGAANRNTVGLLHGAGGHAVPVANDGIAHYIAPCRTHLATDPDVGTKEVRLKLEVVAGLCLGRGIELTFRVHKPNAHMTVQAGSKKHHQGDSSAGFRGVIHLTPRNVSFHTLRWREGVGALKISGPFPAGWAGMAHAPTAHQNAVHGTISNIANGNTVSQVDNVYSGEIPYATILAAQPGIGVLLPALASGSTVMGTEEWPIDWEYTYPDLATGNWANDWIKMQKAVHKATLFQNGRMVMFKGHVGCASGECMKAEEVSFEANDLSSNWP
jgi:hypothetical protein